MKLTEENKITKFDFEEFEIEGMNGTFYINDLTYDSWCEYKPDEVYDDYVCYVGMVDYDIDYLNENDELIKVELDKAFVECNLTREIEETIDWNKFISDNYEQ